LGDFYGRRPGQIGLSIGSFDIAFMTNALNTSGYSITTINNGVPTTISAPGVAPTGSDLDNNFPRLRRPGC